MVNPAPAVLVVPVVLAVPVALAAQVMPAGPVARPPSVRVGPMRNSPFS